MPKIYFTTIAATVSATLWAVYLFLNREKLTENEAYLVILFILNLALLVLVREKSY